MSLYEHNRIAYEATMRHFETHKRACIVHATGTGKSYVIGAVSSHFDRVLVIAPNNFVLDETRKVCKGDVTFRTYSSIMYDDTHEEYDLIVLDEFHRGGAEKWGLGVQRLLDANKDAYVFGTSATHIRYLDNQRNMADELFDGNVVSHLPLSEALDKGILPTPVYVSGVYDLDLTSYKKRVFSSMKSDEWKDGVIRKLDGIAHNWENAQGIPTIMRKYFSHDMQRVIVFCSKVKRASEARKLLSKWFGMAGFNRVRYYNIDYKEKRLEQEMRDFQEPLGDYDLKVAISVNMLNEGVHIPRVDSVIMLRSTISRIIIEQQIGRCLTSDNKGMTPVVLDLVNNVDSIGYNSSWVETNGIKGYKGENEADKFPFVITDECRDLRTLLCQLNEDLSRNSWTKDGCREEAIKYKSQSEFRAGSRSAYNSAKYHGWLEEICPYEIIAQKKKFTKEECREEAIKYKSKKEFMNGCPWAYYSARNHGWLEEICPYEIKFRKNWTKEWAKEECQEEALKYQSRTAFSKGCDSAYRKAQKEGWLDEICSHMIELNHRWTLEECKALAMNYTDKTLFIKENPKAYKSICNNGWKDECCSHMTSSRHTSGYTDDELIAIASSFSSWRELTQYNESASRAIKKRGEEFFNKHCSHLKVVTKHKWTEEELVEYSKTFKELTDFREKGHGAYAASKRMGKEFFDKVTAHMIVGINQHKDR